VVAITKKTNFQVPDASTLNILFWAGFSIGRGFGIFYANYFTPVTMIVYDLIGCTASIVSMFQLMFWSEVYLKLFNFVSDADVMLKKNKGILDFID